MLRAFPGRGGVVLGALLVLGVHTAFAQRVTISGRVVDRSDNAPVGGAEVQLSALNRRATTNLDGRYVLALVAPGTYVVRVTAIGFSAAVDTVTVGATAVTANFSLARTVMTLEQIAVTPVGDETQRESGAPPTIMNNVDTIIQTQTVSNMGDLLSGRVPGVAVMQSGGSVGTGTRILIRGQSSISLSNAPVYYVDGIKVESSDNSLSIGTGGQTTSRIDDIDPNDIASIEVIKGPSAGTLYGTQAANGVIRITTKHGLAGRAQWTGYSEVGVLNDMNQYPTNYFSWGHVLTGANAGKLNHCTLAASTLATGPTCAIDSVTQFNVLENSKTRPIGNGYRGVAGLQVSGGSEQVQYYLSGDYTEDLGTLRLSNDEWSRLQTAFSKAPDYTVYRPNQLHAVNLRSNIHAVASPTLDFTGNLGLVQQTVYLPQNDNNVTGLLPSGLFGTGDTVAVPGAAAPTPYGFFLPGDVSQIQTRQDVNRLTGSLHSNWLPNRWLSVRATAGLDYTGRMDLQSQLRGQGPNFSNFRQGRISDNRFTIDHYTAEVGGTAQFSLTPDLRSKTSIGMQFLKDKLFGVLANAQNLPPGGQAVTSGAIRTSSEQTTAAVTLGEYLEQEFAFRNRVFVTGGLRNDRNSAFGTLSRTALYPKIQGSWVISEESFFPRSSMLSNLRLRAAYGATGNQPGTTAALQFFSANTAAVPNVTGGAAGVDQPAILLTAFGNSSLKPERSAELEMGFDAGILHDGVRVEFTWYNKKTHDALVSVPLPPSNGVATSRFVNLGSTENKGIEVGFDFLKQVTRSIALDGNLSIARNTNRLLSLGTGIPTIKNGLQWDSVGFPLFGWWDRPIKSFADANNDGIIEPSEMVVDSTPRYLGSSIPLTNITLNAGITFLHGRVRLGGQLDYRGDYKVYNLTERFRCAGAGFNCAGINNPKDGLSDQARAIGATVASPFNPTAGGSATTQAGYIEDGTFLKLREANLTYYAPTSWAHLVRAQRLQFTLTGRNLLKWTNYSGLDPEVNGNGTSDLVDDFLTAPPIRSIAVRVTVGY